MAEERIEYTVISFSLRAARSHWRLGLSVAAAIALIGIAWVVSSRAQARAEADYLLGFTRSDESDLSRRYLRPGGQMLEHLLNAQTLKDLGLAADCSALLMVREREILRLSCRGDTPEAAKARIQKIADVFLEYHRASLDEFRAWMASVLETKTANARLLGETLELFNGRADPLSGDPQMRLAEQGLLIDQALARVRHNETVQEIHVLKQSMAKWETTRMAPWSPTVDSAAIKPRHIIIILLGSLFLGIFAMVARALGRSLYQAERKLE